MTTKQNEISEKIGKFISSPANTNDYVDNLTCFEVAAEGKHGTRDFSFAVSTGSPFDPRSYLIDGDVLIPLSVRVPRQIVTRRDAEIAAEVIAAAIMYEADEDIVIEELYNLGRWAAAPQLVEWLRDADHYFTGGNPGEAITEWSKAFDADSGRAIEWLEAGFWNADTARTLQESGLTASHFRAADIPHSLAGDVCSGIVSIKDAIARLEP